jgi:hypothetical protein
LAYTSFHAVAFSVGTLTSQELHQQIIVPGGLYARPVAASYLFSISIPGRFFAFDNSEGTTAFSYRCPKQREHMKLLLCDACIHASDWCCNRRHMYTCQKRKSRITYVMAFRSISLTRPHTTHIMRHTQRDSTIPSYLGPRPPVRQCCETLLLNLRITRS